MKLAIITDDGYSISKHFGRAAYYQVLTIEDGKVTNREMREKLGHNHFADEPHSHDETGQKHGVGPAADHRHGRMAEAISDCQAIICGGMGSGAFQSLQARSINPIITDLESIDEAVEAFIGGEIVNRTDKLH
jgi:predicted Fe-Mo cluster-binding NifX family protein